MSQGKDWVLDNLQRAFKATSVAKATVRAEVRAEYAAVIQREILRRTAEAEAAFADQLAQAKEEHGLTVTEIQDRVLSSRTWSIWEKWRDLAGITPEREKTPSKKKGSQIFEIRDGLLYLVRHFEFNREVGPWLVTVTEMFWTGDGSHKGWRYTLPTLTRGDEGYDDLMERDALDWETRKGLGAALDKALKDAGIDPRTIVKAQEENA